MKYIGNVIKNYTRVIPSVFSLCLSLFLFFLIISKAVNSEVTVRAEKVTILKNDNPTEIILFDISNNDITTAEYNFSENSNNINDKRVISYFENFFLFVKKNDAQNNILEAENFDFITASNSIETYFRNQTSHSEIESLMISETIPYYIAKKIIQKNINKRNIDNCESFLKKYIEHFSQFDSLSKETADVICFYYYIQYENVNLIQKDNKERLKSFINEIDTLQQRHPNELGENGTYKKQSLYLNKIHKFFKDKQDSLIGGNLLQLAKIGTRFEKIEVYKF